MVENNPQFFHTVCLSDEATFKSNGILFSFLITLFTLLIENDQGIKTTEQ